MLKKFVRKLLWGIVFYLIGNILHYFLYPVILALFSAFFGTETFIINLIPAWPAIIFWIFAFNLRVNQSESRRRYLAKFDEQRPSAKETFVLMMRGSDVLLDCLAFLVILFVYLITVLRQTGSIALCVILMWIYIPLYIVADLLNWFLVHRHWQKDKF